MRFIKILAVIGVVAIVALLPWMLSEHPDPPPAMPGHESAGALTAAREDFEALERSQKLPSEPSVRPESATPTVAMVVRVVLPGGQPAFRCKVRLVDSMKNLREGWTDHGGSVLLEGVAIGVSRVALALPFVCTGPVEFLVEQSTATITVSAIAPAYTLQGVVFDGDRVPLPGVYVGGRHGAICTDANGSFELPVFPSEDEQQGYFVLFRKDGFESVRIINSRKQTSEIQVVLHRLADCRILIGRHNKTIGWPGYVILAKKRGGAFFVRGRRTLKDDDEVVFTNVGPGDYRAAVQPSGIAPWAPPRPLSFKVRRAERHDPIITVGPSIPLLVRVRGAGGIPIVAASVRVESWFGEGPAEWAAPVREAAPVVGEKLGWLVGSLTLTGQGGSSRITLGPDVQQRVVVDAAGYGQAVVRPAIGAGETVVRLEPAMRVEFVAGSRLWQIMQQLGFEDSRVAFAPIESEQLSPVSCSLDRSGSTGEAEIRLHPGVYSVVVSGLSPSNLGLKSMTRRRLDLGLAKLGTGQGRIVGDDLRGSWRFGIVDLVATISGRVVDGGSFDIESDEEAPAPKVRMISPGVKVGATKVSEDGRVVAVAHSGPATLRLLNGGHWYTAKITVPSGGERLTGLTSLK